MRLTNLKTKLVQVIGPLGGYQVSRRLTRDTPRVLMYHRFSDQPRPGYVHRMEFTRQVDYLVRHFNVMRLDQLLERLVGNDSCPENAVVITVDDGYADFHDIAWPVLREAGVPATLFVTTRFVDGGFWLWPDLVRYILEHAGELRQLDIPAFAGVAPQILKSGDREALWQVIVDYLLSISEPDKQVWLKEFARQHSVEVPSVLPDGYHAVNWDQVREMAANDIEIGAHTRTHPSLGMINSEQLADEVEGSIADIQRHTGNRPRSFCYPNGQPGDYTEIVKAHVRHAGCKGAVTAFYDRKVIDDLYEIRRFTASEKRFQFEKSANGVALLSARWLNSSNRSASKCW